MYRKLDDFCGVWQIGRRIVDHIAGTEALFGGRADFIPDERGLRYHETGSLQVPGQRPVFAERRYLWRDEPGGIRVLFEDGRFFHRFEVGTGRPAAEHWCDPDRYKVSYDFTDWPEWRAVWRVRGPRKDYILRSRYTPEVAR